MGKAKDFLNLMKEQSVANLGAIPSPALAVVPRPGTSYKLDIPMITKKKRKKKKQSQEAVLGKNSSRKLYHKGKAYDIDIGPGKKTIAGAFGVPR